MAKSTFSLFNILVLAGILVIGYMFWNRYKDGKLNTPKIEERIPVISDRDDYYDDEEDVGILDTDEPEYIEENPDTYIEEFNETSEPTTTIEQPVIVVPRRTVVIEETAPKKTPPPAPKRTYSTNKRRYTVVVGSFSNGDFANDMIKRCKKAGYEVETKWNGGMKRVAVVLFCPANELDSRLGKVQKQFNRDAWVMKK